MDYRKKQDIDQRKVCGACKHPRPAHVSFHLASKLCYGKCVLCECRSYTVTVWNSANVTKYDLKRDDAC